MTVTGVAISKTGSPVPYATVSLRKGTQVLATTVARQTGGFTVSSDTSGDNIQISSVGYQSNSFPINPVNDSFYYLEADYKEEGNVTVTSTKKKSSTGWLWALLAAAVIIKSK